MACLVKLFSSFVIFNMAMEISKLKRSRTVRRNVLIKKTLPNIDDLIKQPGNENIKMKKC